MKRRLGPLVIFLTLLPVAAQAQTDGETNLMSNFESGRHLLGSLLVFLAIIGYAMREFGLAQSKNGLSVLMKSISGFALSFLCFFFLGFALMFGQSYHGLFGARGFTFFFNEEASSQIWYYLLFHGFLCALGGTIARSASSERMRFPGAMIFVCLFSVGLYPLLGHWIWHEGDVLFDNGDAGWLRARGYHDFGGATILHIAGGAAALASLIIVGPRRGAFSKKNQPLFLPGHHIPLSILGTFFLWLGWIGFHVGILEGSGHPELGRLSINLVLASATALWTSIMPGWIRNRRPEVHVALCGLMAGLVSMSAGADVMKPHWACLTGAVAGLLIPLGQRLMAQCRLDDPLGTVSIHLLAGAWGVIAACLFHDSGLSSQRLLVQLLGLVGTGTLSLIISLIIFRGLDQLLSLNPVKEARDGLDFSDHSANAYPDFYTKDRL